MVVYLASKAMKKYFWWLGGIVLGFLCIVGGVLWKYSDTDRVTVKFFDVGQGDAILISSGTNQILIDGGKDAKVLLDQLGRSMPFWDRMIEAVIITHPDDDHSGGLSDLNERYRIGQWLVSGAESASVGWQHLLPQMSPQTIIFKDTTLSLGDGKTLTVLWPNRGAVFNEKDTNTNSIVARLDLGGKKTFLLTGDLPTSEESQIAIQQTEILKVAHHGSKYSTSNVWLDGVQASATIVSVGANNRYGHPAAETLARLTQHQMALYRTDKQGAITYVCESSAERCQVSTEL